MFQALLTLSVRQRAVKGAPVVSVGLLDRGVHGGELHPLFVGS